MWTLENLQIKGVYQLHLDWIAAPVAGLLLVVAVVADGTGAEGDEMSSCHLTCPSGEAFSG